MAKHRTFNTLRQLQDEGTLVPLPHVRLRAQMALAEPDNPADLLRVALILIQRVHSYFGVVEYCPPRGDIHWEYPAAYDATLTRHYSGLYRKSINVMHPAEGPPAVWNKAGCMCLDTAFAVAEWEICQHYPEAIALVDLTKAAALTACKNSDFSDIYWRAAKSRLGTKRIRAMLDTVQGNLQHAYFVIHPETGIPSFRTEQNFIWARKKLDEVAQANGKSLQYARWSSLGVLRAA